jgi:hypothetical protein
MKGGDAMTPEELRAKALTFRNLPSRVTASVLTGELIAWDEERAREADEQASTAPPHDVT